MASNNKYITTPIYYVNDVPHIGHAYTTIAADVLNRFYKQKGDNSFFLTGTDEHGAKIAEAAEEKGETPKKFVDSLVPQFKKAWEALDIEYDGFIRTTDKKHEEIVTEFIKKLQDAGYVEKRKYEGLYCVGCEKFISEDELEDGKCPHHGKEPVKHSEENHFFLLSKLQDKLKQAIESDEFKVAPEARKNEVLGKINQGLEDVSISRQAVEWGAKFPGDDTQTVYVWVDALINYYSATKIFEGPKWPADLHLIGKDILWFHAIIWPAMLIAIHEKLPKEVFAHGFFTIGGKKMSKSLGNAIDPIALSEKYGADAVRYAILREFPFGEDGDISEEKIAERYKTDLGNELGNLVQRTLTMVNKYELEVGPTETLSIDTPDVDGVTIREAYDKALTNLDFSGALEVVFRITRDLNAEIERKKPWELEKTDKNELAVVMGFIYQSLLGVNELILPFMPETAEKMKKQLKTLKPEPLFPRIEE
ncbi:MAG: class I tRNA ligase family protein [Patescibacteria group bacterium]|nr:class I tRNA ligase family protein [Patescibacteria group bacterium]